MHFMFHMYYANNKTIEVPGLWIVDDCITIQDGTFSWSEDDPSVLKEFVFENFCDCCAVIISAASLQV